MTPPVYYTQFSDSQTEEFTFGIFSNSGDTYAEMVVEGTMAEYVTLSDTEFELSGGVRKNVVVTINYPSYNEIETYGRQILSISAIEKAAPGVGFSALTAMTGKIAIEVPTPGQYGKVEKFGVSSVQKGLDTEFSLEISNKGTETLAGKTANVFLYSPTGEQLKDYTFNNLNIAPGETKKITEVIESRQYSPGKYTAKADFIFDSSKPKSTKETHFFIGSTDVVLDSHTKLLERGTINKVQITLQSIWGSPLKGIRGSVNSNGHSENIPILDFKPFGTTTIPVYIDVPKDATDIFTADLDLQVPIGDNEINEKTITLTFDVVDELPKEETDDTSKDDSDNNNISISKTALMIAGLIILVVGLIGLNVYFLVLRKK